MKEEKIPLTVEIFNVIISAYAKSGKMRRAFKLYNDVSDEINVINYLIFFLLKTENCL